MYVYVYVYIYIYIYTYIYIYIYTYANAMYQVRLPSGPPGDCLLDPDVYRLYEAEIKLRNP